MITDENLPDGWVAVSRRTEYDQWMDREMDSVTFATEDETRAVRINEVEEPKEFEGWGYQVSVDRGRTADTTGKTEDLGVFEDLDEAGSAALGYMRGATA